MRDDYKIVKSIDSLNLEVEAGVTNILRAMEAHTKLTVSELANTALKRFISAHKDFLPSDYYEKNPKHSQVK
ncbi:MAG: hypothetical protein H7301_01955 [Cryobacterium sp.]|nr:hypothetical protein [Oligoflexia bacterium]